jgi:hypothetical protein
VDGFPQQFMSLSSDVVALRVAHWGLRLPDYEVSHRAVIDRNLVAIALPAQGHKRGVDRNPRKPGGETGSPFEILHASERIQEGFLEYVLSILPIPGDSISGLKDPARMTFTEFDKRVHVSRFSSGRQHLIAQLRRTVFHINNIYCRHR